ncbi:hypothetical protein XAP6164_970006 [Xanthomonas phaseoli pv. phaseoli]|nr:hypothetical protein XAP6164_970006 [Xanthomonas phaseoli pv. phaseoli]
MNATCRQRKTGPSLVPFFSRQYPVARELALTRSRTLCANRTRHSTLAFVAATNGQRARKMDVDLAGQPQCPNALSTPDTAHTAW